MACPLNKSRSRQKRICETWVFNYPIPVFHHLTLCQHIIDWYKEERKKTKVPVPSQSGKATRVLDLSGKSGRKKPPYQLHQAFSVLYWKPQDSPLRREVQDLWERRDEDPVRETLKPFLKETAKTSMTRSKRLMFHIAVMRWKCSLLSPEELAALQDWINEQQKARKKESELPWSSEANEYGDALFSENAHIQRYFRFC